MIDIELSIVVVTWNCEPFIARLLDSLSYIDVAYELIVIDNASTDGTPDILRNAPHCRVVVNSTNLGFALANNQGIALGRGRYIALINPDVELLQTGIKPLINSFEAHPNVGLVGPQMLDPHRTIRRSGMRFPSLGRAACRALALDRLLGKHALFGGQMMTNFDWKTQCEVDVLNGWFWLVRRQVFDDIGLLDGRFFMYGEDLDFCKRLDAAGWKRLFDPTVAAIHHGGGSSRNAPIRFYLEMQQAKRRYWKKHHGVLANITYVAILILQHILRFVGFSLLALVRPTHPHARSKARRYAAYLGRSLSLFRRADAVGL